ncbi:IS200/IS605 family transposase [Candidatus Bealeia paramacronuclearis]|uniref:IS200/IS605 family transposase n=1 Tax=Candidatus Bealeia paramacronuclearis TaxID=1921001 RepID=A0ABZ2C5S7_9PROT|nr:IS200/IS605 family transposase [Candidatus Bealeia paramacronuclearis]MEB3702509.1 IS200/IS605 family transposase [Candidatus Bealeia paramacronuclearis]
MIVSKYRRKILNEGSFAYFTEVMNQIREKMPEVIILTMNHDKDHIHLHLHLSIPPKIRVSDAVRTIKSMSGKLLKKKFEYMRKAYWGVDGIWSDGYFVSTVGVNEYAIKRYIEHQGQEDLGQAQLVLGL